MAKVHLESSLSHLVFVVFFFLFFLSFFFFNSLKQNSYKKEKGSTGFNKSAPLYPTYDSV